MGNGCLARYGRARSPSGPRLAVASARRPYQAAATSAPAKGFPMTRPQGRQSLNVSLSHPVSMSRCLNVSAGLGSQVSGLPLPLTTTHCLAARRPRHRRSGDRRADMRPETRDLAEGHETLRGRACRGPLGRARSPSGPRLAVASARRPYQAASPARPTTTKGAALLPRPSCVPLAFAFGYLSDPFGEAALLPLQPLSSEAQPSRRASPS